MYHVQYKNFGLLKNTLVNNVVYVHYVVTNNDDIKAFFLCV